MKEAIVLRLATEADAEKILDIYAPYIKETAVTFEYEVPSLEAFRARISHIIKKYPFLIAEEADEMIGYAYASAYGARRAYDWSAEVSIYLAGNQRGMGLGKRLYEELEFLLREQNIINVYACITESTQENPYITRASQHFHAKHGYKKAAHFQKAGYKFNQWYDIIWMEKQLRAHPPNVEPFIPITLLKKRSQHCR